MQDLNPQPPTPWRLAEGPYELADYCLQNNTRLLILLCSWLDSREYLEEKQDMGTVQFWAARLRPLWTNETDETDLEGKEDESGSDTLVNGEETIVVICNRSGEENGMTNCSVWCPTVGLIIFYPGTLFAGSSALFSLRQESGRPTLMTLMDRQEEGVRIWSV
jgi:protein N-terminal amidase